MSSRNLTGKKLGNYHFLENIGSGGFAHVYHVKHSSLDTDLAAKVLRSGANEEDKKRFLAEARTVATFEHPNIIRVTDFVEAEDEAFFVMQYIPDGSLKKLSLPLPMTTITTYVNQIAEALQRVHDRGLVHRDIKPDNLLMGPNGKILVSDFGIVSLTSSFRVPLDIGGTYRYMAPEQRKTGARRSSDQYSLAVVVYEWLCGHTPFMADELIQLWYQHEEVPPPSLCERIPGLPKRIEDVIFRALAKNPDDRYPTIMEFALALEQASLLPGESYYPPHVALAMRERYYTSFTSPWSGQEDNVMRHLGEPEEITPEIAKERTSCHEKRTTGYIRPFQNGYICWSERGGAQHIWLGFADIFKREGGIEGRLGFPLSHEEKVISSFGTKGVCQRFEGGPSDGLPIGDEWSDQWDFSKGIFVYWSKHGTYPVWGGPHIRYEAMGGPQSFLGFPISMERKAEDSPQGTEGWWQDFEGGSIHWSYKYGGIAISNSMHTVYNRFNGSGGKFGFPIAPEEPVEGQPNMRIQQFEGGVICVVREEVTQAS